MASSKQSSSPDQVFTSADRIRQLNEVDKDVARLIHSAGLAIQALTNARSGDSSTDNSLQSHQSRFKEATSQYFALLSSIDVRLRRQVYALEEAAILAPESASRTGETAGAGGGEQPPVQPTRWMKDTVGKDKEAELWAAAREFVEHIRNPAAMERLREKQGNQEKMEVD
ncbi:mediator of RNA polymerase II transcription subunit 11 [Aspergillus tanneri]|uniref:Mediator of RNA polymerase II transcription subunit 11 n=1 Tax=Aspergillus tanneri TaxID=1220188 RepID=A0A5M9MF13_9EURO|nr:uncharacterized protein ATNIH1004_010342 [Aspergillus tanneri]KAA8643573.1 hypothetical protein ATNIH1004_010342 [Aspergillus tanneri]